MPHVPKPGDRVPVQLPDELVTGVVQEANGDDELVVLLERPPFVAKQYKMGVPLKAQRLTGLLAGNRWEVVT